MPPKKRKVVKRKPSTRRRRAKRGAGGLEIAGRTLQGVAGLGLITGPKHSRSEAGYLLLGSGALAGVGQAMVMADPDYRRRQRGGFIPVSRRVNPTFRHPVIMY